MEVSLDDVSTVIRLVREVCDRWDDPCAWRHHLLRGACQLVNGHVGVILADYNGEDGWFGDLVILSSVGVPTSLTDALNATVASASRRTFEDASETLMPTLPKLHDTMKKQGWVTTSGYELAGGSPQYAMTKHQDVRTQMDCDDFVLSIRIVDVPRRPEAISIDRPQGATPFSGREVALLKLLHDEVAPLIGVRLTTEEHFSRDGLSKRLRETLTLLLAGYSEKQVAGQLQLGTRTVHDYVARLYEHFHVSSRAELLAYFVQRTPVPRNPALGSIVAPQIQQ